MTFRVGFFKSNLRDHFPRGARRAARAIVEIIDQKPNNNLSLICLDDNKLPNSRPLSFIFNPLNTWLKNNSLYLPRMENRSLGLGWIKNIIRLITPPIFYPILKTAALIAKLLIAKLKRFLNKIGNRITSDQIPENTVYNNIIALCELDAFVAFEPFNEIWSLPVENFNTLGFGWFYDAVPKRINEGEHWRPDFFDASVSLMALRAKHIFCDSKSAESDLHHFFPASVGKTSVIHLGHDIERFEKRLPEAEALKALETAGVDPSIPYFLFVGTIEPRKNITGILLAAQKLKQTKPDSKFQIVLIGQIPGQHEIKRVIRQTNQMLPVHALNYLPDNLVSTFMNRAAGFVFPSKWEGFGIPNLEAMTAETLVITSDLGPMPEVCGEHALYCDPYDHTSIASQMIKCLEMPSDERTQRIKAAKNHASQFTWKKSAEAMMATLENLLEARKKNQT